jgi:hypothetical protein
MTHDDEAEGYSQGYHDDHEWVVSSDFWAEADNGYGQCEGTAKASWYGDAYWVDDEDKEQCRITISSEVKAKVQDRDNAYISAPPGYHVQERYLKATLEHQFEWGDSTPSLHHNKGAVEWELDNWNCFEWIQQKDTEKFEFDDGHVEYMGCRARADVGHCW